MKSNNLVVSFFLTAILTLFFFNTSHAQIKPGYINRQATSIAGRAVLDPNNDGYTSATTAGFGLPSDVATSEIPYKILQSYSSEPFGDLRRGPNHNYSDFVPDGGNDGFYTFFDATNLMFRLRLGSIMSGSKGYSVLIDTDGKFGASGASADPNYVAATTGINGNPGFEIEIVLETNFRIAVYNVDGSSTPTLITQYTNWQDMSQVSLASTNDNGDPDFFMDFYVPFSVLQAVPFNLTTSSALRIVPTTVMSPQAAIGGPKSDIYGLSDPNYPTPNSQYEAFINAQPPVTVNDLTSGGGGFGGMCTAAPALTGTISAGTVNISGTWTASSLSGAITTATITVYKNGVSAGTVSAVTSGSIWTLNSVTVVSGDVITAKAQASGESMCLVSNSITVTGCSPAGTSSASNAAFGICVNDRRGMAGTKLTNAVIKIYSIAAGGSPTLFATDGSPASPSTFLISYGSPSNVANTTWEYNGSNNSGSIDPCSGGPNDIPNGSYYITITESGKCESSPIWGSCVNQIATTTPVITQTTLYNGNSLVSGTATANSTVRLYVNGVLRSAQTATAGGAYSFSSISLTVSDVVQVFAQAASSCISAAVSRTVTCFTNIPLITADANGQVTAGQAITGLSSEPAGTTIRVYNATGPTLVSTVTVQANGSWSTSPYTAVAGTTYYANAQNGSCSISANSSSVSAANQTSSARCGSITGPVAAGATSVSGTLSSAVAGTTVRLYEDGELIGSVTTATTAWTISSIASTVIYSNAVLSIGIQETGNQEVSCAATLTVSCSPTPVTPIFTPTNTSIVANQTVTYTITNATAGTFYAIANANTGRSLGKGIWATANGNLNITTDPISSPGTYSVVVKANSLSGVTVCTAVPTAASVTVNGTLPVELINFYGKWNNDQVVVSWKTATELNTDFFIVERSNNAINFMSIGTKDAVGNSTYENNYSLIDQSPLSGVNYYRLKILDVDGRVQYSSVLRLWKKMGIKLEASPNPFQSKINVQMTVTNKVEGLVRILDQNGRVVHSSYRLLESGTNNIIINGLERLSSGTYLLDIRFGNNRITEKIIKMN